MRRCLALFLIPLAACADHTPSAGAPTVRDSAGIRIVENTGPNWRPGQEWGLSAEPVLEIGGGDSEEDQLFGVRGAYRLGDGRIVIANGGTREIRFYAPDGEFLSASGGEGQGPGEFEWLEGVWRLRGDSLVAKDQYYKPQLSIFDPNGVFVRTVRLDALLGVIGVFDDGSILAQGSPRMAGELAGFQRYDAPLYHIPPEGEPSSHIGDFRGSEIYQVVSGNSVSVYEPFFARSTQYLAAGGSVYVAANDSYEYRLHKPDGTLRTIVRRNVTPLPVRREDVARHREAKLAPAPDANRRRRWEEVFREMPVPNTMPAYAEIHVDDLLNVWVLEYQRPGSDEVRWTVFDSAGAMLGEVQGHPGVTPYHIGPAHMVGLWREDLDVEHVRVYEITKPGQ